MRLARITKIADLLVSEISKLDASELKKLIRECQRLTNSNCWWVIFGLKRLVIDYAKILLKTQKSKSQPAEAESE